MSIHLVMGSIIVIGSALLGSIPFDKKRIRATWAKAAFGIFAVVGITAGVVEVAWDLGCFELSEEASHRLDGSLSFGRGLMLGLLLALILSRQLIGTKRTS